MSDRSIIRCIKSVGSAGVWKHPQCENNFHLYIIQLLVTHLYIRFIQHKLKLINFAHIIILNYSIIIEDTVMII